MYTRDKYFRKIHFSIGLAALGVFYLINLFLSQYSASGAYTPYLIGIDLYERLTASSGPRSDIGDAGLEALLFAEPVSAFWRLFLFQVMLAVLRFYSFYRALVRWVRRRGLEVADREYKNIVDATIGRLLLHGVFLNITAVVVTVCIFDMVQISAVLNSMASDNLKSYLPKVDFDFNFLASALIFPIIVVWSLGSILVIRNRMLIGDLHGYRPERLEDLISKQRAWLRHEKPRP